MPDLSPTSPDSPPTGPATEPAVVAGVVAPEALARAVRRAVTRALAEDLGEGGDVTSRATVPPGMTADAEIVAREAGVVSGLACVVEAFAATDARVELELHVGDGEHVIADQVIATVSGPARGILGAERTALNFLGRLSGIATATAALQELLEGTGCQVRDTRKTTPGLRLLEKAAVADGGGNNHRIGLFDAILVKENHLLAAGGVEAAVAKLRAASPGVAVQVEVDDLDQLALLLDLGVQDILLDNFTVEEVRHAAARVDGRANLEVSGNLDASSIRAYAEAVGPGGRLAVGAITHSAPSLDVALDIVSTSAPAPIVHPIASTPASSVPLGADEPTDPTPSIDQSPVDEPADPPASVDEPHMDEPDLPEPVPADLADLADVADAGSDDAPEAAQPVSEEPDEPAADSPVRAPLRKRVSSFFGREDADDDVVDLETALAGLGLAGDEPVKDVDTALAELGPPSGEPLELDASDESEELGVASPDPSAVPVAGAGSESAEEAEPVPAPSEPESVLEEPGLPTAVPSDDPAGTTDPDAAGDDQSGPDVGGGGDDVEPFERKKIAPLFGALDSTTDYSAVEAKGEPFSWRSPREG